VRVRRFPIAVSYYRASQKTEHDEQSRANVQSSGNKEESEGRWYDMTSRGNISICGTGYGRGRTSQLSCEMTESTTPSTVNNDAPIVESEKTPSEIWFSDGNIILEAGNKRFKVHRAVLSMHSPVFKDMFTLPKSLETETIENDIPLVILQDAGMDVEYMLREFYGCRCVVAALNVFDVSLSSWTA
jgi:hypothetical protein